MDILKKISKIEYIAPEVQTIEISLDNTILIGSNEDYEWGGEG